MRRSIVTAAFMVVITAGLFTAANAVPAGPGLLAAKANETNVTEVLWRSRHWGGWRGRRIYGSYGWRRWRPRVYGYYGGYRPRAYGWMGYRGCW